MTMQLTSRQVGLATLALFASAAPFMLLVQLMTGAALLTNIIAVAAFVLFATLFFVYKKLEWRYTMHVFITCATLIIGIGLPEPFVSMRESFALILPAIFAAILLGPVWVIASALACYGIVLVRAGGAGVYTDPQTLAVFLLVIGGLVIARLVADSGQRTIARAQQQADQALHLAEDQAQHLDQANTRLGAQLEESQRQVELINSLETPVVQIADKVLYAPLIGHIDQRRIEVLHTRLLNTIYRQRATHAILDLGSVGMIDTNVVHALMHVAQAVQLLGCQVLVCGLSAAQALTITHLGVDTDVFQTVATPQDALNSIQRTPRLYNN